MLDEWDIESPKRRESQGWRDMENGIDGNRWLVKILE
jgi:hypothetical protein